MIVNLSGYKFVTIPQDKLYELRKQLRMQATDFKIKGTILLSAEGINAFLAGTKNSIEQYIKFLHSIEYFASLEFKKSFSSEVPFNKFLVKIKHEIISMGHNEVMPEKHTASYLSPQELKNWYETKKNFVMLDTRNDYEIAVGSFDGAVDLNIENFREFPDAIELIKDKYKNKPVVTFCTGGIRCEKAAEYMQQQGFTNVYQLQGGILNYFEKVGQDHYIGDCFVFDKRITVDAKLLPTHHRYCLAHNAHEEFTKEELKNCEYCQHLHESQHLQFNLMSEC